MTQTLYSSRSMVQLYQRCRRLRWLSNYEGADGMGLEPVRRSVHLVVGGAVHSGLEVLLREGQAALDMLAGDDLTAKLDNLFVELRGGTQTVARQIENRAVAAALADLASEMGTAGVELDAEERAGAEAAAAQLAAGGLPGGTEVDFGGMGLGANGGAAGAGTGTGADSPIVIEFDGLIPTTVDPASVVIGLPDPLTPQTSMGAVTVTAPGSMCQSDADYLREELAALVEGLVRAYSRRRLRPLLADHIVLEVEREGNWKLGEIEGLGDHDWYSPSDDPSSPWYDTCAKCSAIRNSKAGMEPCRYGKAELRFLSRHDALLLERSTGYLYLQSYKTTGSWDRRKEMDAQVDMQGLSEAVDVERRLGEAWELLQQTEKITAANEGNWCGTMALAQTQTLWKRVLELVSEPTARWLSTLPSAPSILGVRYEYLLKGSRKKDRRSADPSSPARWNQESILCRAWCQEGITADDRRWAWTWDWYENDGRGGRKSRRLDYRSWHKQPVWRSMLIAEWIDLLDKFAVQEGAEAEDGSVLDALGEQFVPVIVTYRNADEMGDLLEQISAQEEQVARDVEEVRRAEREGGYAAKRTALNRLFPQTRTACSYPGVCSMRSLPTKPGFCFGPPDPEHDPAVLEHFRARVPNHPAEGLVRITDNGEGHDSAE